MVVPPDKTVLAYKSFLISTSHFMIELKPHTTLSTSHFMIELYVVSWIPHDSIPKKDGWKRASGARKRSLPMVMTCPSGNSYDFSNEVEAAAVAISCSKSRAT